MATPPFDEQWANRVFALEPCIVPYHVETGVTHWILWHNPAFVGGDVELDPRDEMSKVT